ncbi:MAG: NAD(P)/FAD-dependent oxidoreductase [Anaerolineae bacterium]
METIDKAQVVIIGGGVIGASVAYHLARKGCRDVILLEREAALGMGSTGRSAGGIRQQFSTPTNIQLSMASVKQFRRFAEELDYPARFNWVGYLFLLSTEEDWDAFQHSVALQQSLGLKEVRLLSPEEAHDLVPQLNVEDILGATFCPTDGVGDPYEVCQGYAQGARRLGVRILLETEAVGIRVERERVRGVQTPRGEIEAEWVVNAAGPYAGVVGRMAGVELPIKPYRRHIFVTHAFDGLPEVFPMTIDFAPSFYFRREGAGILMGMTDKEEPPSFNTNVNWSLLDRVVEQAMHRVPVLAEAGIMNAWAGLYDTTPDANPILGPIPEVEGFLCAAGFSGHGFMHSPMTGQLIAELIVDGQTSLDITPLSIERFAREEALAERNVI